MKILLAHTFYQHPGGEDVVFNAEKTLLEAKGHTVITYVRDNSEIRGMGKKITSAAAALWSQETYHSLEEIIRFTKPDVAHFHNTFILISPSAYYACQQANVPVVQTLHNFRLICPGALLLRESKPCEDCVGLKFPWPGVIHACWRNSHIQSAVVATMIGLHNILGTWQEKVDCYIALTEFSRQKFIQGGLPAGKIVVKPNFITTKIRVERGKGDYALFVGCLSNEKGLDTLLEAWQLLPELPLKIVGDGPLYEFAQKTIAAYSLKEVELTGTLGREAVFQIMQNARFLIIPSKMYETFGMVALEAFACSVPVLATNLGSLVEIVDHRRTGLHFEAGNAYDLAEKVGWAWVHPEEMRRMGQAAYQEYQQKYTPEKNYQQLMEIYQKTILTSQKRK